MASSAEQFVTAPPLSRRALRGGAAVVAAGAGIWLAGNLMLIFGSGIQSVQSTGTATTGASGSFALYGDYLIPFTVFGIAAILLGAGYLIFSSGLTWPNPRGDPPLGFRTSRPQAVLVAVLFLASGVVAIAIIPFLSSVQGLVPWLISAIILRVAAGRHFAFLKHLRIEAGLPEKLGGRGLRTFSKVALAGVVLTAAPILLYGYQKAPGSGPASIFDSVVAFTVAFAPMLWAIAKVLEFFILPLVGALVFGLMIPKAFRLMGVGKPPVLRATMPVDVPSKAVEAIPPKPAPIASAVLVSATSTPQNPPGPLPAVMASSAPIDQNWVLNLQTEIAALEKALAEQKDAISQLGLDFENGRIDRSRFEELERPELDRIAALEKDLAERRQQLPVRTLDDL